MRLLRLLLGLVTAASAMESYIVMFKKATPTASQQALIEGVEAAGGKITQRYETVLSGFAATMPAKHAEMLQEDPGIEAVEHDGEVTMASMPLGLEP